MGRSTETFSKKEKEKKRLKKAKEKMERAEERKSSAVKGKTLGDMMAYIDEYGNITSKPPDPSSRKLKIDPANIQIAIPKQEDIIQEIVRTGIVGFFNEDKGYGFIKDIQTQESIFVHANNLAEPIKENNKVTFEIEAGAKGPTAVKVKLSK